jgi:hypothetical protein
LFFESLKKDGAKKQEWDSGDAVRDFNEVILERWRRLSNCISRAEDFDKRDMRVTVLKLSKEIADQYLDFAQFSAT